MRSWREANNRLAVVRKGSTHRCRPPGRDQPGQEAGARGRGRRQCTGQRVSGGSGCGTAGKSSTEQGVTRRSLPVPEGLRPTLSAKRRCPGDARGKARPAGGQVAGRDGAAARAGTLPAALGARHSGSLRSRCVAGDAGKARTSGSTVVSHGWSWEEGRQGRRQRQGEANSERPKRGATTQGRAGAAVGLPGGHRRTSRVAAPGVPGEMASVGAPLRVVLNRAAAGTASAPSRPRASAERRVLCVAMLRGVKATPGSGWKLARRLLRGTAQWCHVIGARVSWLASFIIRCQPPG